MINTIITLAEISIPVPQITLSDLGIILGIGGSAGAGIAWLFGTRFVAKDIYEKDKAETDRKIAECNQSLQLSQQASASLELAVKQLTLAINKNTDTVHALDTRLAIVETRQHQG
jgi:septal ring factor EnvC (AmiA/AmiB activator)